MSVCVVCMDAPLEGSFVPFGHMAACLACCERVMRTRPRCPICSADCSHFMRIFICEA